MRKSASKLIIEALKSFARGLLEVYVPFSSRKLSSQFLELDSKFSGKYYLWVTKNWESSFWAEDWEILKSS